MSDRDKRSCDGCKLFGNVGVHSLTCPIRGENNVLVEEIWIPTKEVGYGQSISRDGKDYKIIAYIANGVPLFLEKDCVLEKRYISKKDFENIKNKYEKRGLNL